MSNWILADERKPEARYGMGAGHPAIISDDVLVYRDSGDSFYWIANYDHEQGAWIADGVASFEPTHWMPLPSAPR